MGFASSMGPELRQVVEKQLIDDIKYYLPNHLTLNFDWSDSCIEGRATNYLDGSIESFSGILLFDEKENLVAEGWIDFVHEGEFLLVFWDMLTIWNGKEIFTEKSFGMPKHVWEQIPDNIRYNYKIEGDKTNKLS
jgi:hypothetical protein